jgi:hypothetical protein
MLNPVFLLSFQVAGDRQRDYPHLLTINLDRARVLRPGETISIRRTLDVGPLRGIARGTPQQLQRLAISTILDPVQDPAGQWRPAAGGQKLHAAYFNRLPARVGAQEMAALFAALDSDRPHERYRALEVLAQLLGEHQRAALKKLSYQPERIPVDRLYQSLLAALRSDSWETRARVLDSLQIAGLDAQMLAAVNHCLAHDHWCVRLMALRLLARQGAAFFPEARRLAERDPDGLVSDLARSYVQLWEAAASQPAPPP